MPMHVSSATFNAQWLDHIPIEVRCLVSLMPFPALFIYEPQSDNNTVC